MTMGEEGPSSLDPSINFPTIVSNPGILEPDTEYASSRGTSFRSLTSYNSFRSCRTYKSMGGMSSVSRSSYKSCLSKHTGRDTVGSDNPGFYDCKDDDSHSYYSAVDTERPSLQLPESHSRLGPGIEAKKEESVPRAQVYLGYVFAILAGITFTVSNVLVKLVPTMDSWTLLLFRCAAQLCVTVPLVLFSRVNPLGPRGFRIRIYMQGIVGGVLLLSIFLAVKRVPLGDAATIFYSAPAFTMLLSCLILKEHCGIFRTLVCMALLGGVLLISRPSFLSPPAEAAVEALNSSLTSSGDELTTAAAKYTLYHHHIARFNVLGWPLNFNQSTTFLTGPVVESPNSTWTQDPIGIIAALSVPVLTAYLVILTRQCRTVHYSVLVLWFGLGGLVVGVVGLLTLGNPHLFHGTQDWVLAVLIAGLGLAGNILMTKALSWVPPGKVMVLRSFEIVAAYILQIVVFNVQPSWIDLGGTVLVMVAVLLIGTEDIIYKYIHFKYF